MGQALSKELNSQLRSIKLDLDMNSQSQRNAMAMARMELVGVEKREDLRNLQRVQAVAAKQEVDTLTDSVADMQHRRNQLDLDKFKSEQELEQRVANMHTKAEDLQLGKEATTAELTDTQSQV